MNFEEPLEMAQWWRRLTPATQQWLIDNNGDAVPAHIVREIVDAGGSIASEAWWSGETDSSGYHFSDDAIDWIEAVGNGESPDR